MFNIDGSDVGLAPDPGQATTKAAVRYVHFIVEYMLYMLLVQVIWDIINQFYFWCRALFVASLFLYLWNKLLTHARSG